MQYVCRTYQLHCKLPISVLTKYYRENPIFFKFTAALKIHFTENYSDIINCFRVFYSHSWCAFTRFYTNRLVTHCPPYKTEEYNGKKCAQHIKQLIKAKIINQYFILIVYEETKNKMKRPDSIK